MRMNKVVSRLFLAGVLVSASCTAIYAQGPGGGRGQGGGGFGGGMRGGMFGSGLAGLLQIQEVEAAVKLEDAQKTELREAREATQAELAKLRPAPREGGNRGGFQPPSDEDRKKMEEIREEAEKKLAEILDPVQFNRLLGIFAQQNTLQGLAHKLVAKEIGLSDDQVAKVKEIQEEVGAKNRELMSGGGGGGFNPEIRDKMTAAREEAETKALALLSQEQKDKFEALKGEKVDIRFGGGRGQGGPGQGGPGGRGGERGGDRGGRGGNRGDRN